jgi:cytochrome c oxidase subunit 2
VGDSRAEGARERAERARDRAERYEKAFLVMSAGMLVVFLGALFYAAFAMGISLPDRAGEIDPNRARQTAPFDDPGLRQVGPDRYEAVILASAWRFTPSEIEVPAGSTVTFRLTSLDVIHGFHVEGTRINAMVVPGQVTEVTYTFRKEGRHLVICHEYCGVLHHQMGGAVVVTPPEGDGGVGGAGGSGS